MVVQDDVGELVAVDLDQEWDVAAQFGVESGTLIQEILIVLNMLKMLFQKIDETVRDDIFFAFIFKSGHLISPFINSGEKLGLLRTSCFISSFLWSLKHHSNFILNSLNKVCSNI